MIYVSQVPGQSLSPLFEKLILENVSSLPVCMELSLVEPFSLCEASGAHIRATTKVHTSPFHLNLISIHHLIQMSFAIIASYISKTNFSLSNWIIVRRQEVCRCQGKSSDVWHGLSIDRRKDVFFTERSLLFSSAPTMGNCEASLRQSVII